MSNPTTACTIPFYGPQYDSQLRIELIDRRLRKYRVIAPQTIDEFDIQGASLLYYDRNLDVPEGISIALYELELAIEQNGDTVFIEFQTSETAENLFARVHVFYDGVCPTIAEIVIDPLLTD